MKTTPHFTDGETEAQKREETAQVLQRHGACLGNWCPGVRCILCFCCHSPLPTARRTQPKLSLCRGSGTRGHGSGRGRPRCPVPGCSGEAGPGLLRRTPVAVLGQALPFHASRLPGLDLPLPRCGSSHTRRALLQGACPTYLPAICG